MSRKNKAASLNDMVGFQKRRIKELEALVKAMDQDLQGHKQELLETLIELGVARDRRVS